MIKLLGKPYKPVTLYRETPQGTVSLHRLQAAKSNQYFAKLYEFHKEIDFFSHSDWNQMLFEISKNYCLSSFKLIEDKFLELKTNGPTFTIVFSHSFEVSHV